MSLCALCAHPTLGGDVLCGYHAAAHGGDWATGNRIMCDFLHRGIVRAPEFYDATASAPRRETVLAAGSSEYTSDRPLWTRGERSCEVV